MVLGIPTTGSPRRPKSRALVSVPSPPKMTRASTPISFKLSRATWETSLYTHSPFSLRRKLNKLSLLDDFRIVPPVCIIPDTDCSVKGINSLWYRPE